MSEKLCLRLTRVIKAPRRKCFEAWTEPELIAHWLAPGSMSVAEVAADARVDGAYRIAMSGGAATGECVNAVVTGVYKEIVPHDRLAFTWTWPDAIHPATTVTVEFRDVAGGTELTLSHDGFVDEAVLARHEQGWSGCLDKLEQRFQAESTETYTRSIAIAAPCEQVFDALATVDGPKGWWTSLASGSAETGGHLRIAFEGVEGYVLMHIDHALRPNSVQWTCIESSLLPDWLNTVIVFNLAKCASAGCELHLRHYGLTPALECFDLCQAGWNRCLTSIKAYAETGKGTPR